MTESDILGIHINSYLITYKTRNKYIHSAFVTAPNAIQAYIVLLNKDYVEEIIYIDLSYETD